MQFRNRSYKSLAATLLPALFYLLAPLSLQAQPAPQAPSVPQPLPEVRALLDKGMAAEDQYKADEATHFYEQALQVAREHKDRPGEAAALAGLGSANLAQAPQKAMTYLKQALPIFQEIKDSSGQADCLLNMGKVAENTLPPQQALNYFESARQLYHAANYKMGQGTALNGMGMIYNMTGQPHKALDYFTLSLQFYQEAGGKEQSVGVMCNIGTVYGETWDLAQALAMFQKALGLAYDMGSQRFEGAILVDLALTQSRMGNTQEALDYYEKSLPLLDAVGNRNAAAICLANMAELYDQTGNQLKALGYTLQALAVHQELGNVRMIATDLYNLGDFYERVGQWQTALDKYQKALKANHDTGNIVGDITILNGMGNLYDLLGQRAKELGQTEQEKDCRAKERDCYERSLRLSEQAQDKDARADTLTHYSELLMKSGQSQQALKDSEEAGDLFREVSDVIGQANVEFQLGKFQEQLGRIPLAQQHYERALQLDQKMGDVGKEAQTLAFLGALEETQHQFPAAEQHYSQALTLLENRRASLGDLPEAKVSYLELQLPVYQRYIRFLLRTGQKAKAFEWIQKAKAHTLIDLMESGHVQASQAMTTEDKQKEEGLKQQAKDLSQQFLAAIGSLDELKRQAQPDKSRQEKIEKQVQEIQQNQKKSERDWSEFQEALYLRNPRLAQQRSARTVTLEEAASCLPADTALLEYSIVIAGTGKAAREAPVLFVVTQQSGKPHLNVYPLQIEADALAQRAQALQAACAGRPDTPAERPYKDLARELYRLLVAPAESALAGKTHLIFCPDGPLWDVPFQALLCSAPTASGSKPDQTPRVEFLWERYEISYAYSATGIKAALDVRQRPNRPQPHQMLLVMANPDFGQNNSLAVARSRSAEALPQDQTSRGLYARGGGLSALPFTQIEANAIRAAFPSATLKTGSEAQESLVKQTGADYRYLHFATHAILNDAAPMLSGIVMARPPKDSSEVGILTARELFEMNLGADMLVLSACETERGMQQQGEGVIGLTWAAFVAGVPTQIVSQWSVDDAATAQLMGEFYRGLKLGKPKAVALRSAALSLLQDGKHSHPFYWAPFLVIGDWH
jgi:CHAT domain-containing protein/tetratricopeptide (TPR) repeat protein